LTSGIAPVVARKRHHGTRQIYATTPFFGNRLPKSVSSHLLRPKVWTLDDQNPLIRKPALTRHTEKFDGIKNWQPVALKPSLSGR
ncbi:hypothetical protein, partial [Burkholderia ubonensis]|uniref:hypothetical protein n=1 Tax=Burkholderia ubonensis TaxID=101571 RepID=UPI001C435EB4